MEKGGLIFIYVWYLNIRVAIFPGPHFDSLRSCEDYLYDARNYILGDGAMLVVWPSSSQARHDEKRQKLNRMVSWQGRTIVVLQCGFNETSLVSLPQRVRLLLWDFPEALNKQVHFEPFWFELMIYGGAVFTPQVSTWFCLVDVIVEFKFKALYVCPNCNWLYVEIFASSLDYAGF